MKAGLTAAQSASSVCTWIFATPLVKKDGALNESGTSHESVSIIFSCAVPEPRKSTSKSIDRPPSGSGRRVGAVLPGVLLGPRSMLVSVSSGVREVHTPAPALAPAPLEASAAGASRLAVVPVVKRPCGTEKEKGSEGSDHLVYVASATRRRKRPSRERRTASPGMATDRA